MLFRNFLDLFSNKLRFTPPIVLLVVWMISLPAATRADINWDGDNPVGNFSIAQNWFGNTSPTWGFASGNLVFNFRNNTSQTSLYYDLGAWNNINDIIWETTFGAGLTWSTSGNGINFNQRVENRSSFAQAVIVPLSGAKNGATQIELNPVNGDLTISTNIFNDNNKPFYSYGSNSKILTVGYGLTGNASVGFNILAGGGGGYGKVKFTAAQSWGDATHGVNVNQGELLIDTGSLTAGIPIALGLADANTAKLWLSVAGGGTTFAQPITVANSGGTKVIGGLNASGTHTYSSSITLNGPVNLVADQSGGTVAFSTGVISGTGSVNINNTATSAGTVSMSGTNTYSGGTTLSAGTLKVGISSVGSGSSITSGSVGTGNLTLNDGTGLTIGGTGFLLGAPQINLAGNITVGSGASARIQFGGVWDLGGGSRSITLARLNSGQASGQECFRFDTIGAIAPTVQNGSLSFLTSQNSSIVRIQNTASFGTATYPNQSVTIGDGVIFNSGNGNFFSTGNAAPALALAADGGKGGGILELGDGASSSLSVMRSAEVYSLAGGGNVKSDNTTGFPSSGTLTIESGNGQTFSGNITESGGVGVVAVTKNASGTQTLSGNNNYSGATTISGGTLVVGSATALGTGLNSTAYRRNTTSTDAGPNSTTVSSGAALDLNGQSVSGEGFSLAGTGISSGGALINNASGIAILSGTAVNKVSLTSGGSWASGTFSVPTVTVNNTGTGGSGLAFGTAVVGIGSLGTITGGSGYTTAPTVTVTPASGDTPTTTAVVTATVSGGVVTALTIQNPGAGYTKIPTLSFGGPGTGAACTVASLAVNSLPVTSFGSGYNIGTAPTLTFVDGGSGWTLPTATASVPTVAMTADASIGGSGNISNNLPVTGNFNLTKVGANTLTMSAASTYGTGRTTTLSAGTLKAGNAAAFGIGSLTLNAGTLDLANDTSVNAYNTTVGGNTTIASDKATASSAGITHTLGTLSIGAFQLNVTKGANVSDNGAGLTFGTTTLTTPGPAVFDVASGVNLTLGAVGGAFSFTKQNSGQLTLNTTSTRTTSAGGTTLSAGTLRLGTANALNTATTTPPLNLNGGTLSLGLDTGSQIGGAGIVSVGGTAIVQLDRNTTGAGVTNLFNQISIGNQTLYLTNGPNVTSGASGLTLNQSSGALTLTAGPAILDIASGVNLTLAGSVSGNFNFTKQNSGTMILNAGSSRSSGTTTLNGGTMVLGASTGASLGTSGVSLALQSGTLDLASDSSVSAHPTTVSGTATIQSDKGTASTVGITHTLGTLSIGANTLSVLPGANVSSGTAGVTFGTTTFSGSPQFSLGGSTLLTLGALADGGTPRTIALSGSGTLNLGAAASSLVSGTIFNVNGGVLIPSVTGSLSQVATTPDTTTVNVNSTGELRGTVAGAFKSTGTGTPSEAISLAGGTLRLYNSAAIDFGGDLTYNSGIVTLDRTTSGIANTETMNVLTIGAATLAPTAVSYTTAPTLAFNSSTLSDLATFDCSAVNISMGALSFSGANKGFTTTASASGNTVAAGATTLGGATAITIGANAPLTVGAITDAGNTLTLKGSGNFGQSAAWASGTSGGLTLDTTYNGIATLNQANTFTGPVTVNAGTLAVNGNAGALGAGNLSIAGGALDFNHSTALAFNRNTTVSGNAAIISEKNAAGAGVTYTLGTLGIGGQTLTVGGGNVTSGTAGVTFGATTLSGSPTFTINNPAGGGSTLLTLGAITDNGNSITLKGNGSFAQTAAWSGTGSFILDATFSGTATMNQANGFSTAATLNGSGTVLIGNNSALGATTCPLNLNGNVTLAASTTGITLANTTVNVNSDFTIGNSANTARLQFPASASINLGGVQRTITLYKGNAVTGGSSVQLQFNGSSVYSTGTLKLLGGAGASTTAPATTVFNTGTYNNDLIIGANATTSFGTGQAVFQNVTVLANGGLNLSDGGGNGRSLTVASLSGEVGSVVNNSTTGTGTATLTVNGSGSTTFAGVIQDGGYNSTTSGKVALTRSGAGTQSLSGNNTYTGATTISGGMLQLTGGSLGNTAVTLSGTSTFGVKPGSATAISLGNATGAASTGGALTLIATSTFDMTDAALSTFNIVGNATTPPTALTSASGANWKFDLGASDSDHVVLTAGTTAGSGVAAITGTQNVGVTLVAGSLTANNYTLLSGTSISGTWQLSNINGIQVASSSPKVVVGGNAYTLALSSSSTAVTLTVGAAAATTATKLAFTTQPSANTVVSTAFAHQPVVQIQDGSGNAVALAGVDITLSGVPGLTGTVTVTTDSSGKATFSGLSVSTAGSGLALSASGGNLTVATSSTFNIIANGNGTYTQLTSGGNWSAAANWSGGVIASGSGNSANFNTLDITADNTVHLDFPVTLTSLSFGDTATGTTAGWLVDNNGSSLNILTLAGTTPSITVNPLGGTKATIISATIAGSTAWSKAGAGILVLSGNNSYSAGTTLSAGELDATTSASALGTGALTLSGANTTLRLANDTSLNFNNNATVSASLSIQADRLTAGSGDGIAHQLGTLSIGAQTLSVTPGANSTSGTIGLIFGATGISAGPAVFDVASGVNLTLGALSGAFELKKQNSGQLTLNTAAGGSRGSTGITTLSGGTLRLGAVNALTTSTTLGPLNLNGGTLSLGVDAGGTVLGTFMTVGGNSTIQVDRATSGTAPAYTLKTLSLGAYQLNITPGSNLTTDSAYGLTTGATTLTGNGVVDVANNGTGLGTLTIGGKLTGLFDFKKQGSGKIVLATALSAGDRSGGSDTLAAGTLVRGTPSALGDANTTLYLNGGILDIADAGTSEPANPTVVGGDVTVQSDYSSANAGTTHTLGTLSIGANNLTVAPGANVISGTAGLAFGATTLTGSPTFTITNGTQAASLSLGAISDSNGRTLTLKGNGAFGQSGVFAGNLGITLDAAYSGTATMNQANTYSGGTTVNGGTLLIGITSTLSGTSVQNGATGTGNVTLATGASVNNSATGNIWYAPLVNITGNINLTGGSRLSVGLNTLDLGSGTQVINVNGKSLSVTGGNTLTTESTGLSQWEIQAGPNGNGMTIQNGVLDLETTAFTAPSYAAFMIKKTPAAWTSASLTIGNNVLLMMGSGASLGGPAVTINSAGILDLAHFASTVASLADGSNGGGSIFNSMLTANTTAVTLTISAASGSTSFSGTINDGPGTGSLSLVKAGASTQTLGGVNTYTGTTTVNAGTLALTGSGSITNTPLISVANGATLDVSGLSATFTLGGSQTLSNNASSTATFSGNANTASGTLAFSFVAGTPAMSVKNGTLTLASGTVVKINNTGAALGLGSYKLISKLAGGAVAGSVPAVTVSGNGASGPASLQIINGELFLMVGANVLNLVSTPDQTNGYLAPVTFTATILTNGAPAGNATGTIIFFTNTVSFTTNGVNGGTTNFSLSVLPRGTNLITAIYSGDGNYLPSTNTLNQVVTNHPPVATDATYYRAKGISLKIPLANLLTNVTDVDDDTCTLQSIGSGLTNATILTDSTFVYYLPGTGAGSNNNDVVSYTVSDGYGGTGTANILINVYSAPGPAQMSLPTNGVVNITFYGIPNYTYIVQTTTNLSMPWWTLSTNTAGTNGTWLFTDPNATNDQQYYRSSQP